MSFVPVVIEQSSRGERSFDIFSRLLRERIISTLQEEALLQGLQYMIQCSTLEPMFKQSA